MAAHETVEKTPLWIPSEERKQQATITRSMHRANESSSVDLRTYSDLYRWSIENISAFWATFWDYADFKASQPFDLVVDDLNKFPGAIWFPGAGLNFAENLMRFRDHRAALLFRAETIRARVLSYAELYDEVGRLARALRALGVAPGDRVVGVFANLFLFSLIPKAPATAMVKP